MAFILFVEGKTEQKVIAGFLKRWLDARLSRPVRINPVKFEGWAELVKDLSIKTDLYLQKNDVIAVISIMDIYGPTIYPPKKTNVRDRYEWGKEHLESKVNKDKYFHFFAVHEFEAWLLSDPAIFPAEIKKTISSLNKAPEDIDDDTPPAKLLNKLYQKTTGRNYKKITHGEDLFKKLDPNIVYEKCPYFKELLDKMLELAKAAGY
jgi:hypothetical protein